MQYPVITSKAAQKDFMKIQTEHADLVRGMADQQVRVATYNQQKAAELANKNAMESEMKKAEMVANTQIQKDAMAFAQKNAELDVKRAALSMKI